MEDRLMPLKRAGNYAVKAFGTCVCVLALIAATSGPSFAGGGHGHRGGHGHHIGHGYHYGHGAYYYGAAAILGLSTLALGLSLFDTRSYYERPRTVYIQPPARYVQPRLAVIAPRASYQPRASSRAQLPPECLMIREYQTRIIVDGKEVEAYGDACVQADGSLRLNWLSNY